MTMSIMLKYAKKSPGQGQVFITDYYEQTDSGPFTSLVECILGCPRGWQMVVEHFDTMVKKHFKKTRPDAAGIAGLEKLAKEYFGPDYNTFCVASQESRGVDYSKANILYTYSKAEIQHIDKRCFKYDQSPVYIELYANKIASKRIWWTFGILVFTKNGRNTVHFYPQSTKITNRATIYIPDNITYVEINEKFSRDSSSVQELRIKFTEMLKYMKYFKGFNLDGAVNQQSSYENEFVALESGFAAQYFYGNVYGLCNVIKLWLDNCISEKRILRSISPEYCRSGILKPSDDDNYLVQFAEQWIEDYYFSLLNRVQIFESDTFDNNTIRICSQENINAYSRYKTCERKKYISFHDMGDSYSVTEDKVRELNPYLKHCWIPRNEYDDEDMERKTVPGNHLSNVTECYFRGRTIYIEQEGVLKCIKFMKMTEMFKTIYNEVQRISELASKNLIPHLANVQDSNVYEESMDNIPDFVKDGLNKEINSSGGDYSIHNGDEVRRAGCYRNSIVATGKNVCTYIVYYVSHDMIDVKDFIVYIEDMSLNTYTKDEIQDAYLLNIGQAANLIANGYVHSSLTSMFHNTDDNRRFIVTSDAIGIASGRHGTGRLSSLFKGSIWSNMRKIGISDFAEIMTLEEFHQEIRYSIEHSRIGFATVNHKFYTDCEAISSQLFCWVINLLYNEFITNKNATRTVTDREWFIDTLEKGFTLYNKITIGTNYVVDKELFDRMVNEFEYILSLKYVADIVQDGSIKAIDGCDIVSSNIISAKYCANVMKDYTYDSKKEFRIPRGWKIVRFISGNKYLGHRHIGWVYSMKSFNGKLYDDMLEKIVLSHVPDVKKDIHKFIVALRPKITFADVFADKIVEIIDSIITIYGETSCWYTITTMNPEEKIEQITNVVRITLRDFVIKNYLKKNRDGMQDYEVERDAVPSIYYEQKFAAAGFDVSIYGITKNVVTIDVSKVDLDKFSDYVTDFFYDYIDAGAVNGAFPFPALVDELNKMFVINKIKKDDISQLDNELRKIITGIRMARFARNEEGWYSKHVVTRGKKLFERGLDIAIDNLDLNMYWKDAVLSLLDATDYAIYRTRPFFKVITDSNQIINVYSKCKKVESATWEYDYLFSYDIIRKIYIALNKIIEYDADENATKFKKSFDDDLYRHEGLFNKLKKDIEENGVEFDPFSNGGVWPKFV